MSSGLPVFSLQYIGCIAWWRELVRYSAVQIDSYAWYHKQSYHNRCHMLSANGVLSLTIPTTGGNYHRPLREVAISYREDWQRVHWNAIRSAYGSAPFYPYYEEFVAPHYHTQTESLVAFHQGMMNTVIRLLKVDLDVVLTEAYMQAPANDYREMFSAKHSEAFQLPRYAQVFAERWGFVSNLSVLDLLFNAGPDALRYLRAGLS